MHEESLANEGDVSTAGDPGNNSVVPADDDIAALRAEVRDLKKKNEAKELWAMIAREKARLSGKTPASRPDYRTIRNHGLPELSTYHGNNVRECPRWVEQLSTHMDITGMLDYEMKMRPGVSSDRQDFSATVPKWTGEKPWSQERNPNI